MYGVEIAAAIIIFGVIALNALAAVAICQAVEKWDD